MFDAIAVDLARDTAVTIARDEIGRMPAADKAAVLKAIDAVLNLWMLTQAATDGTIQVHPFAYGLLSPIGDLLNPTKPKRIHHSKLRPEQCAGPGVRCPADLLGKLWTERYPPTRQLPIPVATALLVERDADMMPVDSIARAVHLLWIFKCATADTYREVMGEKQVKVANRLAAACNKESQGIQPIRPCCMEGDGRRNLARRSERETQE